MAWVTMACWEMMNGAPFWGDVMGPSSVALVAQPCASSHFHLIHCQVILTCVAHVCASKAQQVPTTGQAHYCSTVDYYQLYI